MACRVPDRDVALLHRVVGPIDPVDPRLSRRVAAGSREDSRDCRHRRRIIYRAPNWPRTPWHAGDGEPPCGARPFTIRLPPRATPPPGARTAPTHAHPK